jgi:hypothetical protein
MKLSFNGRHRVKNRDFLMEKDRTSDRHIIRELVVYGVAYLCAAIVGVIILGRFYWFFEWNTDSPGAARQAFLASVVVVGGMGPAIAAALIWICARIRRLRH